MSGAASNNQAQTISSNDLTLIVNGKQYGGWEEISVTRGIEIMPSHFDVSLTERFPGSPGVVDIQPGQPVVVKIGGDEVVTGRIDRYVSTVTDRDHRVRIMGRGNCRELVDCSAGMTGPDTYAMSISDTSAIAISATLCTPFGITVKSQGKENDRPLLPRQINFGETPWQIIDGISRYRGLIPYEDESGNLVLASVGTGKMASGFSTGANIIAATVNLSADQRFSDYAVVWTSAPGTLLQIATALGIPAGVQRAHAHDTMQPIQNFRPRAIVSEQNAPGIDLAQVRADWEANRRNGRSQAVSLTCDSWRDGAGKLWQPNMLAFVNIPECKVSNQNWLIAEVNFRRGDQGTTAELTLMPPGAFTPLPSGIAGTNWQVTQDLKTGAASPGNPNAGKTAEKPTD